MMQMMATMLPTLAVNANSQMTTLSERLEKGLLLMVVGMGVVFVALVLIGVCISLLGWWLRNLEAKPLELEEESSIVQTTGGGDQSELIAVLTAAAMAIVGKSVNVRKVTFINQNTVSGWAEVGRVAIHTSHNLRRNM
jgi:Na+-transporting methylmalonyl-CoA/oxaloacetate decarboxylase gamma subunit